jgi:hypothetical protein
LDGIRHGGHTPSETLAYLAYLSWRSDQQDAARVEQDRGVRVISPNLGPQRRRGLLGLLFGGR